jgi:hypothetical protein
MREWLLYVALMALVFVLFFRERNLLGALTGLLISGPLYLGLGAVLAKLGYQRKTIKQMRAESKAPVQPRSDTATTGSPRPRPAPTKRTSSGPSNRPNRSRRPRR